MTPRRTTQPHRHRIDVLPRHARPQLACCALQQRAVDCEWQPRLAIAATVACGDRTHAQRVVEVGRVHQRAAERRA